MRTHVDLFAKSELYEKVWFSQEESVHLGKKGNPMKTLILLFTIMSLMISYKGELIRYNPAN